MLFLERFSAATLVGSGIAEFVTKQKNQRKKGHSKACTMVNTPMVCKSTTLYKSEYTSKGVILFLHWLFVVTMGFKMYGFFELLPLSNVKYLATLWSLNILIGI